MLGKANNFFAMSYFTSSAGEAPFAGLDLGSESDSYSDSDSDFGNDFVNPTNDEERSVALAGDAYESDDELPFALPGDGDEDEDEVYKELCDCFPNCGIKPPDYIKLMNAGGIKAVIAVVEAQDALMAQALALARDAG